VMLLLRSFVGKMLNAARLYIGGDGSVVVVVTVPEGLRGGGLGTIDEVGGAGRRGCGCCPTMIRSASAEYPVVGACPRGAGTITSSTRGEVTSAVSPLLSALPGTIRGSAAPG
jgi:hypothetical protein